MEHDDERLAALIDNELDEDERRRLLERLAEDEGLRDRLGRLRQDRDRIVSSFDALLTKAPVERLRAALPAAGGVRRRFAWSELAAGVVLGLMLAGAAQWIGVNRLAPDETDSWRTAVVEYMELFTPDTFAFVDPDGAVQSEQLKAVGAKVQVAVTPDKVAVPGLRYRMAVNLNYEGAPLGEIAYTDAAGAPVLFCMTANGAPEAPPQTSVKSGLSYVAWSRGGKSYMFVGRMPERQIADLAQTLVARF